MIHPSACLAKTWYDQDPFLAAQGSCTEALRVDNSQQDRSIRPAWLPFSPILTSPIPRLDDMT